MDSEKPYVRIELEKLKELNIDIEKDNGSRWSEINDEDEVVYVELIYV